MTRQKCLRTALWALNAGLLTGTALEAEMLDPATDKPGEEWCYLAKSTTIVGVPFQPDVTQITFDGAVFTRNAELCFFYGDKDRPLLARGKTFLEGWIPVVQYAWKEGDIDYDIEYFAAPLDGESAENTVNFILLRMRNTGTQTVFGAFAAALRHTGGDYRFGGAGFFPHWPYEMTDSSVSRDGKLAYAFTPGVIREVSPGVAYAKPFSGQEQFITARAECCLARYRRELKPGESFAATFKMPRVPVANTAYNAKVLGADYQVSRANIIAYWTKLFQHTPVIELPEKRFQDAYRASLVHVLLATRADAAGKRWHTDGLPYPDFFLTSVPEMAMLYLTSGLPEYATGLLIPGAIAQQQGDGLYFDRAVASGKIIPATQGHILYSIAQTVLFTQDKAFAEKIYPSMQKGVAFIASSIKASEYGLLPRCWPYDAEMIDGHYTGQNMFALMGVRHAARVARFLGKTDVDAAWTQLAEQFEASILKALAASARPDGYIPTGLYKYAIGIASSRPNWEDYMYDADWENMILVWPTEVLAPTDPRVQGTLERIRKDYAEGIMTYRHGMFLHQYITANMIEQYLASGDTHTALKDFYHQLLHSGSTHESFENLVKPWADRMVDPGCPPPHAWGTSKQGLMVRHFLLMESGGKCGLEPGQRELWLFHCLSPAWVKPGEHIAIRNAPTEFGKISAEMSFSENGAQIKITVAFHEQPARIRLRVPYFKELVRFKTDARKSRQDDDCILVSPDATTVSIEWKDKPGAHQHTMENILTDYRSANRFKGAKNGKAVIETGKPFLLDSEKSDAPQPLSFELVRKTFQYEYTRLASDEQAKGRKPVQVRAPAMLIAAERRAAFEKQFGKAETNLTTGKPATASISAADGPPPMFEKFKPVTMAQLAKQTPQGVSAIEVNDYAPGHYTGPLTPSPPHADMNARRAVVINWKDHPQRFIFSHEASYCPLMEWASGAAMCNQFFEGNYGDAELFNNPGRKERNSYVEIVESGPRRAWVRWTYFCVNQNDDTQPRLHGTEDYLAYPNGMILRRMSYESLMPNESKGYSTQPVELFGVAPVGSTIKDLFPSDAKKGDYHTLAAVDLYSDRRYDIFWDDKGGVRRQGDDATLAAISRSPGCALVLPFREGLMFAVYGTASGFPAAKNQLIDHCTPGAEGGAGWGTGLWDHWPIGWLNSQTSLWKPGSPYAYSFGSIGQFFVPDGKRIKSFGTDYPAFCKDMELNRWTANRVFYVLLGTAHDWDEVRRIGRGWLDKGAACARPESIEKLK